MERQPKSETGQHMVFILHELPQYHRIESGDFLQKQPQLEREKAVCELMGVCSGTVVRPVHYLKTFRLRGQQFEDGEGNPDGWGIALYPDGRAVQVIKEPMPEASSKLFEFLSTYEHLYSKISIVHIRKASRGSVDYSNTHPFSREVQGKDFAFAHNGTIRSVRLDRGRLISSVRKQAGLVGENPGNVKQPKTGQS